MPTKDEIQAELDETKSALVKAEEKIEALQRDEHLEDKTDLSREPEQGDQSISPNFTLKVVEKYGVLLAEISTTGWVGPPQLSIPAIYIAELRDVLTGVTIKVPHPEQPEQ
jgi:hypothetical protein